MNDQDLRFFALLTGALAVMLSVISMAKCAVNEPERCAKACGPALVKRISPCECQEAR